jgi:hypothetical protein
MIVPSDHVDDAVGRVPVGGKVVLQLLAGSWYLPLAIYLGDQPIGIQDVWANDFARVRSVDTG